MRSRNLAAIIGISLVSACGGSSYGDYGDDDRDTETDEVQARDGGAWDARAKDAGPARGSDAGNGGGSGSGDDEYGDDADDDDDDDQVPSDAGVGSDAGKADAGGGAGGDCATLTYQTFGRQFLTNYCVSCHGGSAPSGQVNLTSLANVTRSKAGAKAQVTSKGMPLGGKQPSDAERAQFAAWIDCGPK